jgi:hypothetical protein
MELSSDLYEDAVQVYTRMIKGESWDAAAAIERIHFTFGARAALRAALIIQVLRMEINEGDYPPRIRFYGYLLQDYPEAIPMLEQAIMHCCRAWNIANVGHIRL